MEVGCGYVMAREGDSLIIATARHVVQDTNSRATPPQGEVRFHGVEEALAYRVLHLDAKDLAFVKVRRPGHDTPLPLVFRDAPLDVRLWLISARREHKTLPTGFDGRMLYRSSSTPYFWAAIPGTAQGDSGSMILSREGIVGMLLGGSSELECLAIGYVMDRLNSIVMPVGK
ncbi:MAG: trypsin-like peptidase domain-containing protein [Flavobacteriales bacterium]|nr:MAG: trypsin-like peptidase domain-containing protein [Flavobacteriales bacterium]